MLHAWRTNALYTCPASLQRLSPAGTSHFEIEIEHFCFDQIGNRALLKLPALLLHSPFLNYPLLKLPLFELPTFEITRFCSYNTRF
jgi:hypothetical protein